MFQLFSFLTDRISEFMESAAALKQLFFFIEACSSCDSQLNADIPDAAA